MGIDHNQNDVIREVYLAEYNNLWQEILTRIDTQNQILNLQIVVIGVSASGVAIIQTQPILYLFGAVLLGLLSWVMIEQTARINNILTYIRTVLSPKIDGIFPDFTHPIFRWPTWVLTINQTNFLFQALSLIKFFIGPVIAILFCIIFIYVKKDAWTVSENILFVSSSAIILVSLAIGALSAFISYILPKTKK